MIRFLLNSLLTGVCVLLQLPEQMLVKRKRPAKNDCEATEIYKCPLFTISFIEE